MLYYFTFPYRLLYWKHFGSCTPQPSPCVILGYLFRIFYRNLYLVFCREFNSGYNVKAEDSTDFKDARHPSLIALSRSSHLSAANLNQDVNDTLRLVMLRCVFVMLQLVLCLTVELDIRQARGKHFFLLETNSNHKAVLITTDNYLWLEVATQFHLLSSFYL